MFDFTCMSAYGMITARLGARNKGLWGFVTVLSCKVMSISWDQ